MNFLDVKWLCALHGAGKTRKAEAKMTGRSLQGYIDEGVRPVSVKFNVIIYSRSVRVAQRAGAPKGE
jgi:hypothetical protein